MAKICPYPFSRIEYNPNFYIPCCFDWLHEDYRKLDHKGVDKWNSQAAKELRKRILAGDYSLCKREYCQIELVPLDQGPISTTDCELNEQRLQDISRGNIEFHGPTAVSITADRRCNLACPSCRPDFVKKLSKEDEHNLNQTIHQLSIHAPTIQTIKMVGDGEVFFSPYLSKFLKSLNREQYPALEKVFLLTNGTLFSKRAYERHLPGISYVKEVSVSIDAGDEETYDLVRGGDWSTLMENLEFISSLRQKNILKDWSITFVVRKSNYKTMEKFVALGEKLKVDHLVFSSLHPWGNMSPKLNYQDEALHLPDHPLHQDLLDTVNRIKGNSALSIYYKF